MDESSALSSLSKENIVPNLSLLSESLKSSLGKSATKSKRGQWYSPCNSPRMKKPASPDEKLPILKLNHFEKTPRVFFGSVKLGSSKIEELVVWNPHSEPQTLRVEKSPTKRGFTLDCTDDGPSEFLTLEADEEVVLPIKWEPVEAGRCREMIIFKWNETHRLQAILMGNSVDMSTKKKRRSVLGNSQSFNTSGTRKPFKPHFSIVTKDPFTLQVKQQEFGHTIPDVREIPQEDERRETYVLTDAEIQQQDERRETYDISTVELPSEEFRKQNGVTVATGLVQKGVEKKEGIVAKVGIPQQQESKVSSNDLSVEVLHKAKVKEENYIFKVEIPQEQESKATNEFSKAELLHRAKQENYISKVELPQWVLRSESYTASNVKTQEEVIPFSEAGIQQQAQERKTMKAILEEEECLQEARKESFVSTKVEFQPQGKQMCKFEISQVTIPKDEEERNTKDVLNTELSQEDERRETFVVTSMPLQRVKEDSSLSKTEVVVKKELILKSENEVGQLDKVAEDKKDGKVGEIEEDKENVNKKGLQRRSKQFEIKGKIKKETVQPTTKKPVHPSVAFDVEQPAKKLKPTQTMKQKKAALEKKPGPVAKKTKKVKLKVASKGVAPTKLKLVKPVKTSIPHHPMPFAAKNMYYDERWIEKQEAGFTRWLNFILTPPDDDANETNTGTMTMSTNKSQPKAPSKEELSLKTYTTRRKMARLRRCSCLLYQSEPVICVIRKIEAEVELGRLAIRPDRKIHADLGIKKNIVKMILSYNPLWLRIGLETIYGEILPVQSNSDINGLVRFVTDHLLANTSIARAYAHPKVPGLYRDGYVEQLCKFTLKKFLFLVLFLDRAKLTRIIDHDPCLFVKDAEFKSSRSLLLTFSREYLKGEGDITKHLSYLGFSINHQQRPIDEIDYAVHNISTDLRDGLRLTRVVELLTHNWQLTQNLRVPAISRLQKIHNVEVFMEALKEHKIPVGHGEGSGIASRHIVDGHREKTLQLLWLIIFNFQVNLVLSEKQLKEEISFLEKNQALKTQLTTEPMMLGLPRSKRESLENDIYFNSPRLSLLLKWCQLVCRQFGIKIENFTVSFSDGRVLCYLLHFYHPSLLPLNMINEDTTLSRNPGLQEESDEEEGIVMDSWAASYSPGSGTNKDIERLKANEKENFKILAEKVKVLGGIPMMTKFSDMSNTIPDEKVVITYTSYLCARLLDLREETRAARKIQIAWKSYQLRQRLQRRQVLVDAAVRMQAKVRCALDRRRFVKIVKSTITIQAFYKGYKERQRQHKRLEAARKIQSAFRATRIMRHDRTNYLRLKNAVVSMQARIREAKCRRLVLRNEAAVVIQSRWRCYSKKSRFVAVKQATLICQRFVRGRFEREQFIALKKAAVVLQTRYRAHKLQREERAKFLKFRHAVVKIQAGVRGFKARNYVRRVKSAIVIQKNFKMSRERMSYLLQKRYAILVQSKLRMILARKRFIEVKRSVQLLQVFCRAYQAGRRERCLYTSMKSSSIRIQTFWRGYSQRKTFQIQKMSAIKIQAAFRRRSARSKYLKLKNSAITIQKFFLGYLQMKEARRNFEELKLAAVKIQSLYRKQKCRNAFLQVRDKVVKIQATFRGHLQRRRFLAKKQAVIVIQRRFRAYCQGRQQRMLFHIQRGAVITIQAHVRGFLARQDIKQQHLAATKIQTSFRSYNAEKKFQVLKTTTIIIQRRYRAYRLGKLERQRYERIKQAVITIQASVRGFLARKDLKQQHFAATKIQASFRSYNAAKKFQVLKTTTIVIQRRYRAFRLGNLERQSYERIKQAAITIQAYVRGFLDRKYIKQQHIAATKIQALFRSYNAEKKFQVLKTTTIIIQRRYRAFRLGKLELQSYERIKQAAITIQAYVRGFLAREDLKQKHLAATKIQASFRSYNAEKKFRVLKTTTISIQRRYRAFRLGKLELQSYERIKQAGITIQAYVRGFLAREDLKQKHLAATKIQASFRSYNAEKKFRVLKTTTISIQRRCRAYRLGKLERQRYERIKQAVIKIQASVRGFLAREDLKQQHFAATKIQASFRSYNAAKKFQVLKTTTIILQRRYRASRLGKLERQRYEKIKKSAITIQAFHRGSKVRKSLRKQNLAATHIQAVYKSCVERRRFLKLRNTTSLMQARFQALKLGKATRGDYQRLRQATVLIQAVYRGNRARGNLQKQQEAATVIQAKYRCHIQKRRYHSMRNATMVLQVRFRALQDGKVQKQHYGTLKSSTIKIQAVFRMIKARKEFRKLLAVIRLQSALRGMIVRREVSKMNSAAVKIQAYFRGFSAFTRYTKLKKAVVFIQARFKGIKQANEFQMLKSSATKIQAFYRGYIARKFVKRIQAAITLQSYYRMYTTKKQYNSTRKAVVFTQACIRRFLAVKYYTNLRKSIVFIQRRYRANMALLKQYMSYHIQRGACIVLQSSVRRHLARKSFLELKEATITIQVRYKALLTARKQRAVFEATKSAVITIQKHSRALQARNLLKKHLAARKIQSYFRMHSAKKTYMKLRSSVVFLQANVRMVQTRNRFTTLKKAALTIQTRFRATLLARAVCRNFRHIRSATLVLQKFHRGSLARKLCRQIRSAIKIQATYRAYVERKKFLKCRNAAIVIQSMVKKVQAEKRYSKLRQATLTIQRKYRGLLMMREQRKVYIETRNSVIVIQSAFRRWKAVKSYTEVKKATKTIQTRYRATVDARKQRNDYLSFKNSAVVFQAAFRARKARKLCAEMRAARVIQSYYRMHLAREDYTIKRQAVIKIQSFAKMKIVKAEFLREKTAALCVQRLYRATKQGEVQRERYLKLRRSAIVVQSYYRGNTARNRVLRMIEQKRIANEAATKIQGFYRGYRLMRETQLYYHYTRGAAITIQSWYRGYVARQLARRIRAVVRIQACYRGMVARRRYQATRHSIIKLQSTIRCHIQRKRYLQLQQAVLLCQRRYQATKAMETQREYYCHYRSAVTSVQAVWRGRQERNEFRQTMCSVVFMQATIKRFLARRRFLQLKAAIIPMQRRYRANCLAREVQQEYQQLQIATLTIQSHYRGLTARKHVHKILAARTIQRHYRAILQGRVDRHHYLQTRAATIRVQAFYRGYCGRKVARVNAAARRLQAVVRGFLARKQFKKLQEEKRQKLTRFTAAVWYNMSVIRVQRSYRQARALAVARKQISSVIHIQRWWRAKLQRSHFLAMRSAATVIQNAARERLRQKHEAATRIQAFARGCMARRTVDNMNQAALCIQAWLRGYQVRRRVKSLKIKTARRRIRVANEAATESMKLCNRTRSALDYLLRCKNLTTVFDVLVNLEVVTRLSYVCCEQLIQNKALHIIFTVIRNSNRSLPHMEILKYAMAILINLAKCPSTYRSIYDEADAVPTLLELMTIFREKDQIFSKTCCVLTILARRDESILQDFRNTPKMLDKVKGAHNIISRKQNLEKRRSTIKAKMAKGTPLKNTPFKQAPLKSHTPYKPRKQSDWAMWQEYVNRIQEPLQAVRSLLKTLEIE